MTQDDPQVMDEVAYPSPCSVANVCQECHTSQISSTVLGRISLRTADEIVALNECLVALVADGKLKPAAAGAINGAVANVLRIPEATREGGALAISSDYIEIMEIVRRLKQLPLETQELVVKALFGERIKSEASPASDPNTASCSERNVPASYHA